MRVARIVAVSRGSCSSRRWPLGRTAAASGGTSTTCDAADVERVLGPACVAVFHWACSCRGRRVGRCRVGVDCGAGSSSIFWSYWTRRWTTPSGRWSGGPRRQWAGYSLVSSFIKGKLLNRVPTITSAIAAPCVASFVTAVRALVAPGHGRRPNPGAVLTWRRRYSPARRGRPRKLSRPRKAQA